VTLALAIRDDLAAAITANRQLPCGTTVQGLADHYGVSPTPVRKALEELIRKGLIAKKTNGRLSLLGPHPAPGNSPRQPAGQPAEADRGVSPRQPVDHLRIITRDIVRMSLQGSPVPLREKSMAERYGIGRTVIRQIFAHLTGQGMLEHIPRRGWHVCPFSKKDMIAFLDIREALEIKALQLAWYHLDRGQLRTMLDGHILREGSQWSDVDNHLHRYFVEIADNKYITDFFSRNGSYYALLFKWEDDDPTLNKQACLQHREILQAILDGDRQHACRALAYHIQANRHVLLTRDPWHVILPQTVTND